MKVVYLADSFVNGTCQKPILASNLLNTVAPASMPRVCSTEGRINFSLHTDSFILVKSTQMRTVPAFFGTTTIPAHQSVGSSILVITPIFSIRSISSFTFPRSGRGILHGAWREKGTASGFNLIEYGLRTRPKPLHRFGYCCFTDSMVMLSTLLTSWSCSMAGLPSSAVCRSFTT